MLKNTVKKSALLINGGPSPEKRVIDYLPKIDIVLAVDSGFDNAISLGITPDVLIGDLDSISTRGLDSAERQSIELVTYPEDKDKSDLELAILHASKTCSSVTIVDSGGGRIDHLCGVFSAMTSDEASILSCEAFVGSSFIKVVRDHQLVKPLASKLISIFPFGGEAEGVSLSGFRWNLNNDTLKPGSTRGLSNEIIESHGDVSVQKGILLTIQPGLY